MSAAEHTPHPARTGGSLPTATPRTPLDVDSAKKPADAPMPCAPCFSGSPAVGGSNSEYTVLLCTTALSRTNSAWLLLLVLPNEYAGVWSYVQRLTMSVGLQRRFQRHLLQRRHLQSQASHGSSPCASGRHFGTSTASRCARWSWPAFVTGCMCSKAGQRIPWHSQASAHCETQRPALSVFRWASQVYQEAEGPEGQGGAIMVSAVVRSTPSAAFHVRAQTSPAKYGPS